MTMSYQTFLVAVVHCVEKFIVEPLCSVATLEENAHPWMTRIRYKVVQHEAIILYADLLDLTVWNRTIPIPDKLVTQCNGIARAILVAILLLLVGVHFFLQTQTECQHSIFLQDQQQVST